MAIQSETENPAAARSAEYFKKAVDHHGAGRLEAAVSAYRAALLGNADDVDVLGNLGIALCEMGNVVEGMAHMRHALRISPDDPDILNNLGNALLEEGHVDDALDTIIHAANVSPADADVRLLLVRAFIADGDFTQASEQLRAAVALDPHVEGLDEVRALMAPQQPGPAPTAPVTSNGNGHAAELINSELTHEVDAPHYDARNGGSRGDTLAPGTLEPLEDPAVEYTNGALQNGHSAVVEPSDAEEDELGHVVVPMAFAEGEADATEARGDRPPRERPPIASGIGFHHPTTIKQLYGNNKIFAWCLFAVVATYLSVGIFLWVHRAIDKIMAEIRIHVVAQPKIKPPPPKLEPVPLGTQHDKASRQPPAPAPKTRIMAQTVPNNVPGIVAPSEPSLPVDPSDPDTLKSTDFTAMQGGGGNDDSGGPKGFPDGKRNGKVYFIRLKHGSGAWDAYADGTKALLAFANKYFPCESETWPMGADEIRDNYVNKNLIPSFLYIYADDTFNLSGAEVNLLQNYIARGGFLFIDARADPAVKAVVDSQMARVLPGTGLSPISSGDSINHFLFRLSSPGIGENFNGVPVGQRTNYGIKRNGHIVVFLTFGNFSHFFEQFSPKTDEYTLAQYQMGANVIAYAIEKGDTSKFSPRAGASAKVTTSMLKELGFLGDTGTPKPLKPGESVKVKGTGNEADPGEIKVLDPSD